jgi:dolichyl-phosphate beta-glucosyltransferase
VTLVIAAYNGGNALRETLGRAACFLAGRPYAHEIIVVNDGSTDESEVVLQTVATSIPTLKVLTNPQNRGKGTSIQRGIQAAAGRFVFYTDADLAYPLETLDVFLHHLRTQEAEVVVGSRVLRDSFVQVHPRHFRYIYRRHLLSRAFNALARGLFRIPVTDTQCGIKGFTRQAAQAIFSRVIVPGFAFDVEALVIASRLHYRILEVPVLCVYRSEVSSVKMWRDGVLALCDLARMTLRDRTGHYQ